MSRIKGKWLLLVGVLALAAMALAAAISDSRQTANILRHADPWLAILALLFAVLSYIFLSFGFAYICKIFGIRASHRDLLAVGYVTIALSHLVSLGGVAGYSMRLWLLKRRGVSPEDVLAPSLFHSYLNNLVFLTILPVGLLLILLNKTLPSAAFIPIMAGSGILLFFVAAATLLIFSGRARIISLKFVNAVWSRVLKRADISSSLTRVDTALDKGLSTIKLRPQTLLLPLLFILFDWGCTIISVEFCFDALGQTLGAGTLLIGFVVGILLGMISLLPGGLGIQDASMAGTFTLLGASFEQSMLAAVLFRIVYYLIPFGISLLFFRKLLKESRQSPSIS